MENAILPPSVKYEDLTIKEAIHYFDYSEMALMAVKSKYEKLQENGDLEGASALENTMQRYGEGINALGKDIAAFSESLSNMCNSFYVNGSKTESLVPIHLTAYAVRELSCNFSIGDTRPARLEKGETIADKLMAISNKWHELIGDKVAEELKQGNRYLINDTAIADFQLYAKDKCVNVFELKEINPAMQEYLSKMERAFPYQDITMKEAAALTLVIDDALARSEQLQKIYTCKDISKEAVNIKTAVANIEVQVKGKFEEAVSMLAGVGCAALGGAESHVTAVSEHTIDHAAVAEDAKNASVDIHNETFVNDKIGGGTFTSTEKPNVIDLDK